eukprot:TRINITY_DN4171_c0_g1_i1.p1 TRINITY_DN4171_c0_g1~~TRINITY_DN4171_c0_g1_i1.p1  ORF type:complete len:945 (+),score=215.29 TRINITY_DN4171_c0_g1_i1:19-2853(+)
MEQLQEKIKAIQVPPVFIKINTPLQYSSLPKFHTSDTLFRDQLSIQAVLVNNSHFGPDQYLRPDYQDQDFVALQERSDIRCSQFGADGTASCDFLQIGISGVEGVNGNRVDGLISRFLVFLFFVGNDLVASIPFEVFVYDHDYQADTLRAQNCNNIGYLEPRLTDVNPYLGDNKNKDVLIRGISLDPPSLVFFGEKEATIESQGTNFIKCSVPALGTGSYQIQVYTAGRTNNQLSFDYVNSGPTFGTKSSAAPDTESDIAFPHFVESVLHKIIETGITDSNNRNPLHYAAAFGKYSLIPKLLNTYDINGKDTYGATPLFWAIWGGHQNTVQSLLSSSADPNILSNGGISCVHLAALTQNENILLEILSTMGDPNSLTSRGDTALFYACALGNRSLCDILTGSGTESTITNNSSDTCAKWAQIEGHGDISNLFGGIGSTNEAPSPGFFTPSSTTVEKEDNELYIPIEIEFLSRRDRIASEILSTEQNYVKSLEIAIDVFKTPMVENAQNGTLPISDNQIREIFGNIEQLLGCNTHLLTSLIPRYKEWSSKQCIGDLFFQFAPFLRLYKTYSINYDNAAEVLKNLTQKNIVLKDWLEDKINLPILKGLPLEAYLIMPIQRIPRYRLLLEDYIKDTEEDHPDYDVLLKSLEQLKIVADDVNRSVEEHENQMKLFEISKKFEDKVEIISPSRVFIMEGELTKVCRKDNQKRTVFLFNDILVYAAASAGSKKYKKARTIYLNNFLVKEIPDRDFIKDAIQISSYTKSFIVMANNPEEKEMWFRAMRSALRDLDADNRIKKETSRILAPVWIPDALVKTCFTCVCKFTFTNRKHHCRQCGNVVCGPCSSNKKILPGQGKQRVCDDCAAIPLDDWDMNFNDEESSDYEVINEAVAIYDYNPGEQNPLNPHKKLNFSTGETIKVFEESRKWMLGEYRGERGWFPSSYVETVE